MSKQITCLSEGCPHKAVSGSSFCVDHWLEHEEDQRQKDEKEARAELRRIDAEVKRLNANHAPVKHIILRKSGQ